MAHKFSLEKFIQNYKPKNLENELKCYLRCEKLENFKLLKQSNKKSLSPSKTYIKFIKIADSFTDKNYNEHIKSGGILINGGVMEMTRFIQKRNPEEWTHLTLKYIPKPKYLDNGEIDLRSQSDGIRIYRISLKNYYVFFKNYRDEVKDVECI
jgi:hypothetical protein